MLKYLRAPKRAIRIGFVPGLALALGFLTTIGSGAEIRKVGEAAPEFELQGSDGKTYKLSDFRGKQAVIVAWYPKAFTGG
jgi:peroxiredoxin Q/BCP